MKYFPNMIVVSGSGKNVGKTWLCCRIISHLSTHFHVTALKTSPHLHPLSVSDNIILNNKEFALVDEQRITQKDSSRMFQAGAKKSYFFQYHSTLKQAYLQQLLPYLTTEHLLVCESAGMWDIISPQVHIHITDKQDNKIAPKLSQSIQFIINPEQVATFDVKMFSFAHQQVIVRNQ